MQVAGFSPILAGIAAMLVWAAHFLAVYGIQAVLCARGGAGAIVFGQPLVPATVLGLSALALLAVLGIGLRAWRRMRSAGAGEEGEDQPGFAVWMAAAIAPFAAIAIVWEAVPALILPPCR